MWTEAFGLSYLGIFFGVAIVIGYLGGAYADRRLHSAPWLSVLGLLLGVAAAFKELFRAVALHNKRQQRRQAEKKNQQTPAAPSGQDP